MTREQMLRELDEMRRRIAADAKLREEVASLIYKYWFDCYRAADAILSGPFADLRNEHDHACRLLAALSSDEDRHD
jgi:hypothetical protein